MFIKKINKIDTSDVLYDLKLEQFVIYPQNVDIGLFDTKYIKENCYRLKMKKKRNLISIDLTNCKNWNECQKIMNLITSGSVKINVKKI
jgi:hypothetical protein